ncbi:DUF2637 domain-containing protein [Actinosynnema mirum]|uniref:DUF2637 domain-containing protein n=1 Tax=Actinosynnema mirum (strain ATCC 29888 / DSM 43827 / JCM 3225 / NBRC 14064 / NCIMB 13271 / NRRL B-12336 / IMRU 3971 / 101) TaxID=446462 RepID=C6WBC2_ACTMD|nr:DUF2637 domain-containing protein [Actinosynnema mirum]ACU39413.1 hypothetical protein Amir_5595 [Actinosynnema mirum DSM 43827]
MDTAPPPTPEPTTRYARRLLARAQADAIRTRAAAEAEVTRAQAAIADVARAEAARAAEHNKRLRELERAEAEARVELLRAQTEALTAPPVPAEGPDVPAPEVTATDRGDRLWAAVLAIPLLSGTTAAMFGQIAALHPRFVPFVEQELRVDAEHVSALAFAIAFAIGLTLETLGLFMARLAHKARLRGDSPALYRGVMWAIVAFASAVNYREWSPSWSTPSTLGVIFAALSVASVLGWELREHRADRDRRAAEIARLGWAPTPIPPRPELGVARWLVAPRHTWTAWRTAVTDRIPDAATALDRATEVITAEDAERAQARAERKRKPERVERQSAAAEKSADQLPPAPEQSSIPAPAERPALPAAPVVAAEEAEPARAQTAPERSNVTAFRREDSLRERAYQWYAEQVRARGGDPASVTGPQIDKQFGVTHLKKKLTEFKARYVRENPPAPGSDAVNE